ncbi:hypothetical protein [Streptomyces cavernicola]|uniref:Uncharacterized protein n=1 Tax=Streptomyces cavernicola TaxID=3043613 RepID=A0ABT6S9L0_9ACTN|nr:hypothetical protein [Streptomyces sp. B-S-A6]MDI3404604.1 hypothetical protein [Streptomyces sp. B-S-A6]
MRALRTPSPLRSVFGPPRRVRPRLAQPSVLGLLGALGLVAVIRVDSSAEPATARIALVAWASAGTGVLVAAILAHCFTRRNARAAADRAQRPSRRSGARARAQRGTIL